VLLGRQAIDEHHLGGHRVAALDVADVVALDPPRRCQQIEQLGQIFRGQQVLLAGPLGPLQLIAGIAHHQLDQVGLLLALGHRQLHLAAAQFPQPLLDQGLLGQGMLHQQLGGISTPSTWL
jgi:hypothetical protein